MAIKLLLLQVQQGPVGDDFGCKLRPGNAPPLCGDLHRALNDVEFAALLDCRLQAIGKRGGEGWDLGRLDNAKRVIALEPDRQVQPRQGHEFRLGGGVELLTVLGGLHLGSQDDLALDDTLALAITGIRQLLLGATERVLGRSPEGLAPEDVVISHCDLVGHRLVGALCLEPGDVRRQLGLLVDAQAAAEVEE